MQLDQIKSSGIGGLHQVVRGLVKRDEHHRVTAALNARVPTAIHSATLGKLGNQVFRDCNHQKQAIWIHVPKNAGTSLRSALEFDNVGHVPIARYAAQDRQATERYFKFAVVRNPWDRLHSSFSYLRRFKTGDTFPDAIYADRYLRQFDDFEAFVLALADDGEKRKLLDYTHMLPQCYWLTLPGDRAPCMDYLARFENLETAFSDLSRRFNAAVELPKLNQGATKDYSELYTKRMRDIVAEVYACDIEAFGYEFRPTNGGSN